MTITTQPSFTEVVKNLNQQIRQARSRRIRMNAERERYQTAADNYADSVRECDRIIAESRQAIIALGGTIDEANR